MHMLPEHFSGGVASSLLLASRSALANLACPRARSSRSNRGPRRRPRLAAILLSTLWPPQCPIACCGGYSLSQAPPTTRAARARSVPTRCRPTDGRPCKAWRRAGGQSGAAWGNTRINFYGLAAVLLRAFSRHSGERYRALALVCSLELHDLSDSELAMVEDDSVLRQ
ncbi:hypothetical protein BV20DRAFT_111051 [Pilatotrama ljubarskyi]|nr:hypothetical protein BV20DRAFT_111051 [Pilatotrama ljubarskyi]